MIGLCKFQIGGSWVCKKEVEADEEDGLEINRGKSKI